MAADMRPVEIKALSGARALPPLILVLYHFCEGHGYRDARWFDFLIGKGYLWVEFFFALSGFILIHVYGARAAEFLRHGPYLHFIRNRLARLYPLHLFTLLSMLLLMWVLNALADYFGYVSIYHQPWGPINTWPSFVANLFLVQAWNLFPWLTWNGASWFVSVEFLLCLLFPLYVLWARGGVLRGVLMTGAGIAAIAVLAHSGRDGLGIGFDGVLPYLMAKGKPIGLDLTFHNSIFRGMAGFAVGVGLAMLHRSASAAGAAKLPDWLFSVLQIGVLATLFGAIYETGWAHSANDIYTATAMYGLIFALSFDKGFLARIFASVPMLALGTWSYAIYLGQTFWLQSIRTIEQRLYPPGETMIFAIRFDALMWWLEPFLLLAVCILWGALLAKLVEHPASAALRRWFSPRH